MSEKSIGTYKKIVSKCMVDAMTFKFNPSVAYDDFSDSEDSNDDDLALVGLTNMKNVRCCFCTHLPHRHGVVSD